MSAYEIGKSVIVVMLVVGALYQAFDKGNSTSKRILRFVQLGLIAAVLAGAL